MLHAKVLSGFLAFLSLSATALGAGLPPGKVGFEYDEMADGVEIGIWYPAAGAEAHQRLGPYGQDVVQNAPVLGEHHPLVVISHGHGGAFSGHLDTAAALARQGFVVAALTHPGDNWRDQSRATQVEDRPKALGALISYMLEDWPDHERIDAKRVGAFGFSAGGFTVLAAAGGRPDFSRIAGHCEANPDFYDCRLIAENPRPTASAAPPLKDARIKSLVVAAPALGFTFGGDGLEDISAPVQLWRADADEILPAPYYADAVRKALPAPPEFHHVPKAGHFDFLAPCDYPEAAPQICASHEGFDRAAFHKKFNSKIVRFFEKTLNEQ